MIEYPKWGVTVFKILGPFSSFRMGEARLFKFGVEVFGKQAYFTTNDELPPKGALSWSRNHLLYFGTRCLNLDWMKL